MKSLVWLALCVIALGASGVLLERITGSATVRDVWIYGCIFAAVVAYWVRDHQKSKETAKRDRFKR